MSFRIPIRFITVFGVTALVALAVGIVFYLGLASATQNTRMLMSDQAEGLVNAMEREIDLWLSPIDQQAHWIAEHVATNAEHVNDLENLDSFMLGVLAATNQVAGVALIRPDAVVRRWRRIDGMAITEDWSSRPGIRSWIKSGRDRTEPSWIEPFFTDTIDKTILLHELPIQSKDGQLLAMLAQIVPIEELSRHIAELSPREGMTPFILYGADHVLAHPSLVQEAIDTDKTGSPLTPLGELDDVVLRRIWSPDEEELFFLTNNNELQTSGAFIQSKKRFFVFLYRYIEQYGPEPWIIGAHLNTETYGGAEGDRLMRSLLSEGGSLKTQNTVATLLYSDIEDFTRLTESEGSTRVVAILNDYFSEMVDILERHQGVVTQFHGDAILATFNVPIENSQHARNAILAASEMLACVDTRTFADHHLRIRIGMDTGPVVAGAVGAAGRLSYTFYGNSVNLAARLEVLNRDYGTRLLISENTARLAGDVIPLYPVGDVQIRGQARSIRTFTDTAIAHPQHELADD